ncbi:MAG TPA: class I SAM-dependent methyltransferase [Candidatus Binatia bacterium]|nr:class I SAM-dependent methyltransferase [Candidatus Binatia bacterium]
MPPIASEGPNAEQIKYWNETAGPKWVQAQKLIDAQIAPLGEAAMARAAFAAGERVLDVGCGCGTTTIELGRRVGPRGSVLGVDLSAPMLDVARASAERAGLANVRFESADAQTHRFEPASFDVAFSRFGVMFFADPRAAFANLLSALRPGGRLAFVAWQALPLNPWMAVPMSAALAHIALTPPTDPHAPGPFAFADAERVAGILRDAGFTDVVGEPYAGRLSIAGGRAVEEAVAFLLQLGPTGTALREATEEVRGRVAEAVRESILPFVTERGVEMDSASWMFTARRP